MNRVGVLKITRVLHAGYIFEGASSKIIFDPIFENPFSVNCHAYPNVEFDLEKIRELEFDAVFISHFHDDHCSFDSLNLLKRTTPIYIYCLNEEMLKLIQELGFQKVYSLKLSQTVQIADLKITPHRALDEEVDCIFQISTEDVNVLNVVDSWIDYDKVEELAKMKWNLILWPFQTMREIEVLSPSRFEKASGDVPSEWIDQLKTLKPDNLVPSSCQFINESWSWYNHAFFPISYQTFMKQVQEAAPKTNIFKITSGSTIELCEQKIRQLADVDWIKPVGPQDVDYEYKPSLQVPSVFEVAKNFKTLNALQKDQVTKFCKEELLTKLSKLDYISEPYFEQPSFVWRLKVYDNSESKVDTYDYKRTASGSEFVQIAVDEEEVFWLTEISNSKLWSALFEAEALTSLYLRINAQLFKPEYEKHLKEISLTEDPLLRVLYDNSFASYQKKQLERIRTTVKF